MVYGVGEVRLSDAKSGVETSIDASVLCAITNDPIPLNWDNAQICEIDAADLEKESSEATASFADLPPVAAKARSYDGWSKDLANWMYRNQGITLLKSPSSS